MSASSHNITYNFCDADALPAETTNVSSLAHNQFYKICPGLHQHSDGTNVPLGQPRCGDGSNYSFLVSRPVEQPSSQDGGEKIVIELSGGGACWDATTCMLQSFFLSFPSWFDTLVGTSCSDISDTILCAKSVGGNDYSDSTFVFVPYCTQDVHIGDEENTPYGVRHVGAHNIYRTLQWVFENFPNPSEIFLTGCSAGGTPLPILYDLINSHYTNTTFGREQQAVNIDVISDSPVFLTPSYFLENYLPNWNAGTLLNSIDFDFDTYKDQEIFPTAIFEHVLDRSKETDQFGFVTHDADQISIFYYRMMSGGSLPGRDRRMSSTNGGMQKMMNQYRMDRQATTTYNFRRRMNDDLQTQWWTGLTNAIIARAQNYTNLNVYVMEGTGHCSFGLNVPLQNEGFDEWATDILQGVSPIIVQNETTTPSTTSSGSPGSTASTASTMTQSTFTPDSTTSSTASSTTQSTSISGSAASTISATAPSTSIPGSTTATASSATQSTSVSSSTASTASSTIPSTATSTTNPFSPAGSSEINNVPAQHASSSFAFTAIIMLTLRFLSLHPR